MTTDHKNDTIAAIATPLGTGGVGIVRISGPDAPFIASRLFTSMRPAFSGFRPYRLHHGRIRDQDGRFVDEVLIAFMPGPGSYTGEDVIEINCHGGIKILETVLNAVLSSGARQAEPGEFTKRAFLNGRMDLTQAEAVAELINARAKPGLFLAQTKLTGLFGKKISGLREDLDGLRREICVALDFPEDDIEVLPPEEFKIRLDDAIETIADLIESYERNAAWRDGALVVLAGKVNAGKSSLLNAFLGRNRAIVTETPGTTRDYLEEPVILDGLPVRLVDTAGLRATRDTVELKGVAHSRDLAARADLVLLVLDLGLALPAEARALAAELGPGKVLVAANKSDLPAAEPSPEQDLIREGFEAVRVSATTGDGLLDLARAVKQKIVGADSEPGPADLVPNLRQCRALKDAHEELAGIKDDLARDVPYDLLGVRLDLAGEKLAEITGHSAPQEILDQVFARFCIGK